MSSHDSLAVFAALAAELQQDPDEAVTSLAIVSRVRDLVPEADRVSLTVRGPRAPRTLASSDPLAAQADALQHALGEGPWVETATAGGWRRSGDVGADVRYPAWGPRAVRLGVGSVLTVALTDRDGPVGALSLYSEETGAFGDRHAVDLVLAYAVYAASALGSVRLTSTLQSAVSSRHVIGMAQGIAMERYGIDQQQSFELLRRLSSTTNVKLREVATQIVETRVIPHERDRQPAED